MTSCEEFCSVQLGVLVVLVKILEVYQVETFFDGILKLKSKFVCKLDFEKKNK